MMKKLKILLLCIFFSSINIKPAEFKISYLPYIIGSALASAGFYLDSSVNYNYMNGDSWVDKEYMYNGRVSALITGSLTSVLNTILRSKNVLSRDTIAVVLISSLFGIYGYQQEKPKKMFNKSAQKDGKINGTLFGSGLGLFISSLIIDLKK